MTSSDFVTAAMGVAVAIGTPGSGYLVWWSRRKAERTKAELAANQLLQAEAKAREEAAAASWPGLNNALLQEIKRLREDVGALRDQVIDCEKKHEESERRTAALEGDLEAAKKRIRDLEP